MLEIDYFSFHQVEVAAVKLRTCKQKIKTNNTLKTAFGHLLMNIDKADGAAYLQNLKGLQVILLKIQLLSLMFYQYTLVG